MDPQRFLARPVDDFLAATFGLPTAGLAGLAAIVRDFAGVAASAFASVFGGLGGLAALSSDAAGGSLSPFSSRLRLRSFSDLKSVSYQPLPARRNSGADTRRFSWCLPHSGHSRSGLSENFCRASSVWPHFWHSYS